MAGAIKGDGIKRGRKLWVPTPKILQQLEKDGIYGFNRTVMAAGLGLTLCTFSLKLEDFPEMMEAIERGRRKGIEELYELSLTVAKDLKYGQAERDRLNRMRKTERAAIDTEEVSPNSSSTVGFQITVIPNKPIENNE